MVAALRRGQRVVHGVVYLTQRGIHRGPADGLPIAATLAAYALATCGLFAVYAVVVVACARGRVTTTLERRMVIMDPVVFNIALLPTLPSLSIDIYWSLASGYLHAELGQNRTSFPTRAVKSTSYGREIAEYGWQPVHPVSPYGPLVTHLDYSVVAATGATSVCRSCCSRRVGRDRHSGKRCGGSGSILGRVQPDEQRLRARSCSCGTRWSSGSSQGKATTTR